MSTEVLEFGYIEFECTECGATIEVECPDDHADFKFAASEIKGLGWIIIFDKDKHEFMHYCPECKIPFLKEIK
jgi:ribosomal protein L33